MGLFDKISATLGSSRSDEVEESDESNAGIFDIPEWAVEDRVNIDKRTEIIQENYEAVNGEQARVIAETLKEKMEDTDGYSQRIILDALEGEVDLDDETLRTIVWTEMASIETIDTVSTYLEQERGDEEYKIQAPMDDRTHPITREAVEEIEERGGGVPMKELERILIEKAEKYEDEGGTPERMEHWVPHERFRFSISRHVEL